MKKLNFLIAIVLLSQVLFAQVSHVTNFSSIDFDNSKSVSISVDGATFTKLDISNYPINAIPGNPELPVKYVRLVIPPNQEISGIKIDSNEKTIYNLLTPIYPIQEPTKVGYESGSFTKPNADIYNQDTPYPSNVVELVNTEYFNGNTRIATIAVYPVQYYPKTNKLIEFSDVSFIIETKSYH